MTVLADVPVSHFQAAWYYSIVLLALMVLFAVGAGWAMAGAVRVWRSGERAAGGIIAATTLTTMLIFLGMLLAGLVGLIRTNGLG